MSIFLNVLLMFMYIFSFKIYSIFDSTLLVGLILFCYFIFKPEYREALYLFLKKIKSYLKYLSLIFFLIIVWLILVAIFNQTIDFTYLKTFIHLLISLAIGIMLFAFFDYKKCSIKVVNFIIITFIVQSSLQLFFFFFPDISKLFNIFRSQSMIELGNKYHNIRGIAITTAGFFSLSSSYSMIFLLYLSNCNTLFKKKLIKFLMFLLLVIGTFFAGRVGFVSLLFIPFILWENIKKYVAKRQKKIIIDVIICVLSILLFINITSRIPRVTTMYNYSFELIRNIFNGTGFQTTSTNTLLEMYDVDITFKSFFIGDGKYTVCDNSECSYYQGTDVGYLRKILYFGIIGLILSFILQYYIFNKKIKNKINICLIILMLILELKGEIIGISIMVNSIMILYILTSCFAKKNSFEISKETQKIIDSKETNLNDDSCTEKVSIIMPIYNSEKYITKTIDTVLAQTYDNFELILVDDGSTDATRDILVKKYKNHNKIKIMLQENSGAPAARNNGLKIATGKYVVFFDSDDYMGQDYLKCALEDGNQYDLIVSSFEKIYIEENKKEVWKFKKRTNLTFLESLYFIPPFPNNKIYLKSIIDQHNLIFDNVKISQDLNFYLKYLQFTKKVKIVDDINVYYQYHSNSVSTTFNMNLLEVEKSISLAEKYAKKQNSELFKMVRILHYTTQLLKIEKYSQNDAEKIKKYFKEQMKKNLIFKISLKHQKTLKKYILYLKIVVNVPYKVSIRINKIIKRGVL